MVDEEVSSDSNNSNDSEIGEKAKRFVEGIKERVKGRVEEIKGRYKEFQEKRKEKRRADIQKRMEIAKERYAEIQQERKLAIMERQIKQHEQENNPLNRFLAKISRMKGDRSESMFKKTLMDKSRSAAGSLLMGREAGTKTLIMNSGSGGMTLLGNERSILGQMLMGDERKGDKKRPSLAAQALFGNKKGNKPSLLKAAFGHSGKMKRLI